MGFLRENSLFFSSSFTLATLGARLHYANLDQRRKFEFLWARALPKADGLFPKEAALIPPPTYSYSLLF
jgi:hypothetical protein